MSEQLFQRVNKFLGRENVQFQSLMGTIEELLKVGERQKNEYITLSQSIAEDDSIIEQLQVEMKFKNETIDKMDAHLVRNGKEIITKENERAELELQLQQANEEIKQYKLQETLLLERLKKVDSRFKKYMDMAEDNLKMAQKVAQLEGELEGYRNRLEQRSVVTN
jgi:chromosome segregation ATPase